MDLQVQLPSARGAVVICGISGKRYKRRQSKLAALT